MKTLPQFLLGRDLLMCTTFSGFQRAPNVFDSVVHRVEGSGGLPICSSKARDQYNETGTENPWLKHNNIGGDGSEEPIRIAESAPHIHHAWARRKVTKICGRHPEVFVSRRSRRRAKMALLKAVTNRRTLEANSEGSSRGNRSCKRRGILPESIMTEVKTKAAKTIRKLEEGSFRLKGTGKPTGQDPSRLWTLLPQPSGASIPYHEN
ncbi:hypothetical protein DFS34DRAFT_419715 [Phlyctochytrium arcticum]|nr:hypothetical protein DFS34DRAFT_419715 [Phlyctochytrium arcticum]